MSADVPFAPEPSALRTYTVPQLSRLINKGRTKLYEDMNAGYLTWFYSNPFPKGGAENRTRGKRLITHRAAQDYVDWMERGGD